MRTRKAILPDAKHIHDLIASYSGDGTLLPRTLAEICENVRDFVVLENEGRIIGCGALHLYGTHLAEIRSITVGPRAQGQGGGSRLMKALLAEAKRHRVDCICLFTRAPEFFAPGIRNGAARRSSRQDLQGLPRLSQISQLRRSCHGPGQAAYVRHPPGAGELAGEDPGSAVRRQNLSSLRDAMIGWQQGLKS